MKYTVTALWSGLDNTDIIFGVEPASVNITDLTSITTARYQLRQSTEWQISGIPV